jgi:hypothetical protein
MTDTMSDQHREYVAALAAYTAAKARLIEAKKHFDPKSAPEAIEHRKARSAGYRAKRRAERNTPEARAERERRRQEHEKWLQERASIGQRRIEERENMPDVLRILTRVGERP